MLTAARDRGYAWEDGEVADGIASVAIAAHDHAGRAAAAVTVTFPAADHDEGSRADLVVAVRRAADELTRRLGGH